MIVISWSFNYLKKLQSQIEKYKDRIGFLINTDKDISSQPELIKLSQELDKLIVSYQNFKKILSESQSLPFSVDFYMSTSFFITNKIDGLGDKLDSNKYSLVKNDKGQILSIVDSSNGRANTSFWFCESGSSVWLAKTSCDKRDCDFIIVTDEKLNPLGILERDYVNGLCSEKALNSETRNKLYRMEEAFDNVPVSVFVLDKEYYIDYANVEAIKNFNEVLPRNYLLKRADFVFSGLFSINYKKFSESEFWNCIKNGKDYKEIEVKLLNHITLRVNIKVIKTCNLIESIVISFVNVDDLTHKVEELAISAGELSQAFSLFLPFEIEKRLRNQAEYKDIYDYSSNKITIVKKIDDGGYWHVINCLRILSQIERSGAFDNPKLNKDVLVPAIIIHDAGKMQPELIIGDVVDPKEVFEDGKHHAERSAKLCKTIGYSKEVALIVKYHHHSEGELPEEFPQQLIPTFHLLKLIDGLSAAITRRNASISFELTDDTFIIHEENSERPEYSKLHTLKLV